jgi:Ni/Co efflux regulator RcnB
MKKIFTLLAAVTMMAAVQAQNGQGNNHGNRQNDQRGNQQNDQRDKQNGYGDDNDNGRKNHQYDNDDRYNNRNSNFERNKGQRIAQINREYEYKIQRVRNSRFMSRTEKKRQIRFFEEERQQEIRRINFSSNRNHNNDRYDRDDNNDRSNRRY